MTHDRKPNSLVLCAVLEQSIHDVVTLVSTKVPQMIADSMPSASARAKVVMYDAVFKSLCEVMVALSNDYRAATREEFDSMDDPAIIMTEPKHFMALVKYVSEMSDISPTQGTPEGLMKSISKLIDKMLDDKDKS